MFSLSISAPTPSAQEGSRPPAPLDGCHPRLHMARPGEGISPMSDPTTGRPASVPDAPERAPGAPEAADGARNSEPSTSLSTGASLPTLPTRPKIGDTRPAPPGPPALQPPSPNGRKGQAPDSGPATERRPSSDGDSDTSVPATGPAGGGDLPPASRRAGPFARLRSSVEPERRSERPGGSWRRSRQCPRRRQQRHVRHVRADPRTSKQG